MPSRRASNTDISIKSLRKLKPLSPFSGINASADRRDYPRPHWHWTEISENLRALVKRVYEAYPDPRLVFVRGWNSLTIDSR